MEALPNPRTIHLDRLRAGDLWDIVIIGGGATGLGAAVEAAVRGHRTLLLDAHDFGKGTSSRSTKLIHGGVRYLAQGNIHLVREALRERAILLRNAPDLVHERAFLVPAHGWLSLPYYGLGLTAYDLLAGRRRLGRTRIVSAIEARRLAPTLRADRLRGGIVYRDGQFDDARLLVRLLRTFVDLGGTALNYVAVEGLSKSSGRIDGVIARDVETGETFHPRARVVVNAGGVFADQVRTLDEPRSTPMLRPSQGIHLVLPRRFLPGETAVMVPRTDDGRVLFAIPWHDRVLLGTTDTPIDGPPALEPRPLDAEVRYLLEHAARYLDPIPTADDLRGVFAGLRPLFDLGRQPTSTARLSREHVVQVSEAGLVTIVGGKWTTYRRMAIDAIDRAQAVAGLRSASSRSTEDLSLPGHETEEVRALIETDPDLNRPLHPDLPYREADVVQAARREWARTVEDVLARRTRVLFLDARASIQTAPIVARRLAEELGRDDVWQREQVRDFEALARGYLYSGCDQGPVEGDFPGAQAL